MRRTAAVLAATLALTLTACVPAASPPGSGSAASSETPKPEPFRVTLIADTVVDPCWDHADLEAGRAAPDRQDWYNHLDARGYARASMACDPYRWGTAEWECLDELWREESDWRHDIPNGIPQAMPASKMANPPGGADWRTNPRTQVRWGLDYILDRYGRPTRASLKGTPCHAGY